MWLDVFKVPRYPRFEFFFSNHIVIIISIFIFSYLLGSKMPRNSKISRGIRSESLIEKLTLLRGYALFLSFSFSLFFFSYFFSTFLILLGHKAVFETSSTHRVLNPAGDSPWLWLDTRSLRNNFRPTRDRNDSQELGSCISTSFDSRFGSIRVRNATPQGIRKSWKRSFYFSSFLSFFFFK